MNDLNALSKFKVADFTSRLIKQLNHYDKFQEYKNFSYQRDYRTRTSHVIKIETPDRVYKVILQAGDNIMTDKVSIRLLHCGEQINPPTTGYSEDIIAFNQPFMDSVIQRLIEQINLHK